MLKTDGYTQIPFTKNNEIPKAITHNPKTSKEIVTAGERDSYFFRMLENKGTFLNDKQIEAVRNTDGPVLLLAGAGSGKTSVLTSRVAYLISVNKVNPNNLLLLTFTVKASEEMRNRISNMPGISPTVIRNIMIGTFHSVFLKLLRGQGYSQNILSNEKHKQIIIKRILKDMGLKDDYDPETILSKISLEKNNLKRPKDVNALTKVEKEFVRIYEEYEMVKSKNNFIDFDDILLETYNLLCEDEKLLSSIQNRFQYIEVDEFQDTNHAQYQILKMIGEPHNNIFVAGDDDQTIFGWRGANNDIILSFPTVYKGTKKITLETNYRSNPYIVGLGNQVIKNNKKRFVKELHTYNEDGLKPCYYRPETTFDEANFVLHSIKEKVGKGERTYNDFCILFRTHSVSRSILDQLTLHDIPFIKQGMSQPFYENSIVKPIIDHLRLIINPNDIGALSGVLPTLYLSRDELMNFVRKQMINTSNNKQPKFKSLLHVLLMHPNLKSFQVKKINDRIAILNELKELEPKQAVTEMIHGKGKYSVYLKDNHRETFTINKEIIEETLDELIDSTTRFSDINSYIQFVQKTINKHSEMEYLKKSNNLNAITLMSIHNAKGLEFPCVYLIGASEGILPHSSSYKDAEDRISVQQAKKDKILEALEEERRLLYVAITRAKEELFITSPKFFRNKKMDVSSFF